MRRVNPADLLSSAGRGSSAAWRQARRFALLFAILFSLISAAQYFFARSQIGGATDADLSDTVQSVAEELDYHGRWDLGKYRRADIEVTQFIVTTRSGLLVDVEGFVPGLFTHAKVLDESILSSPRTIVTETGERWRLLGRHLAGGSVIMGLLRPDVLNDPDGLLEAQIAKFGSTLQSAKKVNVRDISTEVDAYAVLDDFGNVQFAIGGIPLDVEVDVPAHLSYGRTWTQTLGDKTYKLLLQRIGDSKTPAGSVLAFDDVSDMSSALGAHLRFNAVIGLLSWMVVAFTVTAYILVNEQQRREKAIPLEEALRTGENHEIEFKAGLVDRTVAHTIAAFANTRAGNIFLGVNDSGEVVGLDVDTAKQRDLLMQKVRDIVTQVVKPAVLASASFLTFQGKTVLRIIVPRGDQPLYFVDGVVFIRQMNSVTRARPEEVEAILRRFYG